jgi:hypothetical protein
LAAALQEEETKNDASLAAALQEEANPPDTSNDADFAFSLQLQYQENETQKQTPEQYFKITINEETKAQRMSFLDPFNAIQTEGAGDCLYHAIWNTFSDPIQPQTVRNELAEFVREKHTEFELDMTSDMDRCCGTNPMLHMYLYHGRIRPEHFTIDYKLLRDYFSVREQTQRDINFSRKEAIDTLAHNLSTTHIWGNDYVINMIAMKYNIIVYTIISTTDGIMSYVYRNQLYKPLYTELTRNTTFVYIENRGKIHYQTTTYNGQKKLFGPEEFYKFHMTYPDADIIACTCCLLCNWDDPNGITDNEFKHLQMFLHKNIRDPNDFKLHFHASKTLQEIFEDEFHNEFLFNSAIHFD